MGMCIVSWMGRVVDDIHAMMDGILISQSPPQPLVVLLFSPMRQIYTNIHTRDKSLAPTAPQTSLQPQGL